MLSTQPELRTIFCEALDRPTPQEQAAFLDQACSGRPELRDRVEALLRAHRESDGFLSDLSDVPDPSSATINQPFTGEVPGTAIGPYKLLRELGAGGMGVVFLAEQAEPVRRQVALKLIRPDLDGRQVISRFEAERQALALMDHPNIARVLDAGPTESGRPYFVMELVQGVPISRYCDEHCLPLRERLGLFVAVCQAVQHAHQKGVIHRDLKPTNVLVAPCDGRPVPKVIDFGVAKAAGPNLAGRSLQTQFGSVVGTLEYMSPEQARLNPLDVDTRSDIYSLGAMLYELLTGTTPLERRRLKDLPVWEVLRLIREEDPPRPSDRLRAVADPARTAAGRGTDPRALVEQVRGELDWIVMKALEKDRGRRYETANGLAMDVGRYLADEPVLACPPTARYRLKKFVTRNRRTLATAALLALTLLAAVGAVAGSLGWVVRDAAARRGKLAGDLQFALERAELFEEQGRRAEALTAFARAELLANELPSDPAPRARLAALRQRLDAEARDQEFLAGFDEVRLHEQTRVDEGASRFTMESAFPGLKLVLHRYGIDLGETPAAEVVARVRGRPEAVRGPLLAALQECLTYAPPDEAATRAWLVEVLNEADEDPWRARVRQASAERDAAALEQLARDADERQQPPSFVVWLAKTLRPRNKPAALQLFRRAQRAYPGDFWANHDLGHLLTEVGQPAEAVRYLTAALAVRPQNPGVYLNRARALQGAGEGAAAVADLRAALALAPRYAAAHNSLGVVLSEQGDLAGALAAYRQAVAIDPGYARAHVNIGNVLREQGDRDGALAAYRHAVALDPKHANAQYCLGNALREQGDPAGALAAYRKAVTLDPGYAAAHNNLGNALQARGDLAGALAAYRKAIALNPHFSLAHYNLSNALAKKGRSGKTEAQYWEAVRLRPTDAAAHYDLGTFLAGQRKFPEAETAFREVLRLQPEHPQARFSLAHALAPQGKRDEAEAELREAVRLRPTSLPARGTLANFLLFQGKPAAAEVEFQELLRLNPSYTGVHYNLAQALLQQGKWPAAAVAFQQAVRQQPQNVSAHLGLGHAYRERGKPAEAEAAFREALRLQPENGLARFLLYNLRARQGQLPLFADEMQHRVRAIEAARVEGGKPAPVDRLPEPLDRYDDPFTGVAAGSVWAWGRTGRPVVLMTLEYSPGLDGSASGSYEAAFLADGPVRFGPHDRVWTWEPIGPGLTFEPFPRAPSPANSSEERSQQMQDLTGRLSAVQLMPDQRRVPLRLHGGPVHRYADPAAGIIDGAIFLCRRDRVPEAVLVVEARSQGPSGPGWHYALAPLTGYELTVTLDELEVWSHGRRPTGPTVVSKPQAYWNYRRTEPFTLPPP